MVDAGAQREVVARTRPFATEFVGKSWWYVLSTFTLMAALLTAAGMLEWWPLRVLCSVLGALVMVRAFITYHDYMHGAILRDSTVASVLFHIYGSLALVPRRSWRRSHNYHHRHTGQLSTRGVGAFPIMSTRMWHEASPRERLRYRANRHPLVLLFGYVTIFAFSICLLPLLREPRRHWDSALALLAHGGLITVLWLVGGFDAAFYAVLLPMTLSTILGSYLFLAQHSFKQMYVAPPDDWSFFRSALESSSYLRLNRLMQWFTGNIGFHHIHHLNVAIPFYRLPEAMAAIPELQTPHTTSFAPRDVVECFRANLWDERSQRMVSYREAAALA